MIDDTFQAWRLDDKRQTFVLAARRTRLPEVAYWGPPLPDPAPTGVLEPTEPAGWGSGGGTSDAAWLRDLSHRVGPTQCFSRMGAKLSSPGDA